MFVLKSKRYKKKFDGSGLSGGGGWGRETAEGSVKKRNVSYNVA